MAKERRVLRVRRGKRDEYDTLQGAQVGKGLQRVSLV